jgi:hypothetical protein
MSKYQALDKTGNGLTTGQYTNLPTVAQPAFDTSLIAYVLKALTYNPSPVLSSTPSMLSLLISALVKAFVNGDVK